MLIPSYFFLGATLYKVLSGRAPFTADRTQEALQLAQYEAAPDFRLFVVDVKIPDELVRITMKALARRSEERYPTISALQHDLEAFLMGSEYLPVVVFEAGDTVIRQGDDAAETYVIVTGICDAYLSKNGEWHVLRTLGLGGVFGEMPILTGGLRTSSTEATSELELRVVTAESLTKGLGLNTAIGAFSKAVADRLLTTRLSCARYNLSVDNTANV